MIRSLNRLTRVNRWTQARFFSQNVQPFTLADIGEGIAEVELLQWFVKEGDKVKSFDKICEVQSDKATVEITSRYDGDIVKVHHEVGGIVKVGAVLVDIAKAGGSAADDGDILATGESDAVLSVPPASSSGTSAPPPTPSPANISGTTSASVLSNTKGIKTTPAVRKIAKENSIDLTTVQGTGPQGRILKEDVLNIISGTTVPISPQAPTSSSRPPSQMQKEDTVMPIRGIQRLMVKSMEAARDVQHLTYGEEICVDRLKDLRNELKPQAEAMGLKMSFMPLFIKAASLALHEYPQLNATAKPDMSSVTHHGNHNIGIAVDSPTGLVVPVLKNVESLSIIEIATELGRLQEAALSGKLNESDLKGGTFTLSNIGSIGGVFAVPVVVVPQVAIGALCRFQTLPRYPDGSDPYNTMPVPTTLMNVSWSADHRVVDGATVARFSNRFRAYVENPSSMLAQLR
jgi:2-oxoisovalerate dehydrogenase E2 component (dihydrolipoyl transacylase)